MRADLAPRALCIVLALVPALVGAAHSAKFLFGPQVTDLLLYDALPADVPYAAHKPTTISQCNIAEDAWTAPQHRINITSMYVQRIPTDTPGFRERHDYPSFYTSSEAFLMTFLGAIDAPFAVYNSTTDQLASLHLVYNGVKRKPVALSDWAVPMRNGEIGPGLLGISVGAPHNFSAITHEFMAQVQIFDGAVPPRMVACVNVEFTQIEPTHALWGLSMWGPFAAAMLGIAVRAAARISAARSSLQRQCMRAPLRVVLFVAISGHQLLRYPALRNFCWPGLAQFVEMGQLSTALVLVHAVRPEFKYLAVQWASWTMLTGFCGYQFRMFSKDTIDVFNTTSPLVQGPFAHALLHDDSSPLRMFPEYSRPLPNFRGTNHGFQAYARATGTVVDSLYVRVVVVWLAILGCIITGSLAVLAACVCRSTRAGGDAADLLFRPLRNEITAHQLANCPLREQPRRKQQWTRIYTHLAVLHGNTARILLLFHMPLTVMSIQQLTDPSSPERWTPAVVFAFFAVLLPTYLVGSVLCTSTSVLYNNRTRFLMFGPLYSMYSPTREKFVAVTFVYSLLAGIVVGTEQLSSCAQSALLLTLEVLRAAASLILRPEGSETAAAPLQLFVSAVRIALVLLLLLTLPHKSLSWKSLSRYYTIMVALALLYLLFVTLMWLARLLELGLRVAFDVPFDQSVAEESRGIVGVYRTIMHRRSSMDTKHAHARKLYTNYSDSTLSDTGMWRTTPPQSAAERMHRFVRWFGEMRPRLPRSGSTKEADAVLDSFVRERSDSYSLSASTWSNESTYWLV